MTRGQKVPTSYSCSPLKKTGLSWLVAGSWDSRYSQLAAGSIPAHAYTAVSQRLSFWNRNFCQEISPAADCQGLGSWLMVGVGKSKNHSWYWIPGNLAPCYNLVSSFSLWRKCYWNNELKRTLKPSMGKSSHRWCWGVKESKLKSVLSTKKGTLLAPLRVVPIP